MANHILRHLVHDLEIGVHEFVVEFDLVISELVVVGVDLVDELSIQLQNLLEFLPQQTFCTLVDLGLLLFFFLCGLDLLPQVCVH